MNFLEVGRVEKTHLGLYVTQERFDCVGRQNIARSRKKKEEAQEKEYFSFKEKSKLYTQY